MKAGMVFAVEPMVNTGGPGTQLLEDGWSVVTADGGLSAHFEHTIAVTDGGPEVLTLPD
jgi:methionyl aminopeptidase